MVELSRDGVQYDTLQLLNKRLLDATKERKENGLSKGKLEWMQMGSLTFDSMSIQDKVKFDPHSRELVGFEQGTLKEDVLMHKLAALDSQQSNNKSSRPGFS